MKRRYAGLIREGKTPAEAMAILREAPRAPNRAALALAGLAGLVAEGAAGNPDARPRRCYCTLVTSDDFLPGLLAMLHSLAKTKPACRHVVVLVTAQVSRAARAKLLAAWSASDALSVETKIVPAIPNPNAAVHVEGWVNAGYTKLHVFNLTAFRKVVYIDADTLVVENVDSLFDRPGAPCPSAAPDVFPPDKFNAGSWSWNRRALFEDMLAKVDTLPSHDGGDTGFLNSYFPDWFSQPQAHRLPFRFNAQRTMHWLTFTGNPGYWKSVRPIAILHFSSNPKPWTTTSESGKKGELEMIWWHYFTESQMRMGADVLGDPPFGENLRKLSNASEE